MLIRKIVLCSQKTGQTGALKRKELGEQLQGIDYIYTVNGQLKSINHPSLDETLDPGQDGNTGSFNAAFGKDVFGLTLDYHTDDYLRHNSNILSNGEVNYYNGLINAQRYKTRGTTNSVNNGADYIDYGGGNQQQIITGTTDELMTFYRYDDEYRLRDAVFGKFNNSTEVFTVNTNNCFKEWGASSEGGIGYDGNGNITSLKRNAYNGSVGLTMDDFTYTYTSNTNKLASIDDAATSTYTTDFDASTSKTFTTNTIGQMTASQAESITDITYYPTGLTKKVTFSNSNTAEYWYDDRGKKIKTKFYDATASKAKYTWYVSDAGGNPLAIYEYDEAVAGTPVFVLASQPVYGSGRIGVLDNTTDIIDYEITDHLGNVRATIKGISAGVYQLTTRTDYYAFGGAMPGRTHNLNTYRYNFQGQENAANSNWQQFELRMHNSDLGRWFAPDPYGQFHSPYVSMGNNPVSMTDPDGGYANPHPHSGWVRLKAWVRRQGWMDGGFFGGGGGEWFTSFDDGSGGNTGGGGDGGSNGWNSGVSSSSGSGISVGTGNSEYGVHGGGGGIGSGGGGGGSAFAANFMRPGKADHYSQNSDGTYSVTASPAIDPTLSAGPGPVGPGPKSSGLLQKVSAPQNSTRNYGGDGSGSFYDNTLYIVDQINQFNPIANGWDAITGYTYGTDRYGNAQSTFETTLKAAVFLPFGKAASIGAGAAKGGTSVLGKYPDYINLAEQLGAKRFNVPTNIWNKMSAAEQWGANQKFLDRMILRGDKVILSNPVLDINKVSGAFRQELDYLIGKGYRLNSTGTQLIK